MSPTGNFAGDGFSLKLSFDRPRPAINAKRRSITLDINIEALKGNAAQREGFAGWLQHNTRRARLLIAVLKEDLNPANALDHGRNECKAKPIALKVRAGNIREHIRKYFFPSPISPQYPANEQPDDRRAKTDCPENRVRAIKYPRKKSCDACNDDQQLKNRL